MLVLVGVGVGSQRGGKPGAGVLPALLLAARDKGTIKGALCGVEWGARGEGE